MTRRKTFLRIGFPMLLTALLLASEAHSTWANSSAVPDTSTGVVGDTFPQIWRGRYEGAQENFKGYFVTIKQASFTQDDCIDTKIRRISESQNEFVFQIDPMAKCFEAGWIVRLKMYITNDNSVVSVHEYRAKNDFDTGQDSMYFDMNPVGK